MTGFAVPEGQSLYLGHPVKFPAPRPFFVHLLNLLMGHVILIGYAAACLTIVVFLPQLIKSLKTKRTKDVSLPMIIVQLISLALWLAYGLLVWDTAIILSNTVALPIGAGMLAAKLRYG